MKKLLLLLAALILSCQYSYRLNVDPEGAEILINGEPSPKEFKTKSREIAIRISKEGYHPLEELHIYKNPFKTKEINISLEKLTFRYRLDTIAAPSQVIIDGVTNTKTPVDLLLTYGIHNIVLQREGLEDQSLTVNMQGEQNYLIRHQEKDPGLKPIGIFECGSQPKQLIFSPDNRYLYITLLDGYGFQIFDMDKKKIIHNIEITREKNIKGFVEGIFIPEKSTFLVSQMMKNCLYEYDTQKMEQQKRIISSGGMWPKIIAYAEKLDLIAVSNWISNTVVLIDYKTGEVVKKIPDLKTPRGIVFTKDNRYMVVASFDGGFIKKIATEDWSEKGNIYKRSAAMRHAVMSQDDTTCWVSNMYHSEVYEIDMQKFTITKSYPVFDNPNTIRLTPDEKYLIVSCRGPNNPNGYLNPSLVDGQIKIIDLKKKEVVTTIYGGNQPTGLDISPDGKYFAFSNFKDNNFEIYELQKKE